MDTSQYAHLHKARTELTKKQEQRSWLLNTRYPPKKQQPILASIEATLSELADFPGYQKAVSNLLLARTWDEYQEHWWTLKVALHLAKKGLLREMETALPDGSVPDMRGKAILRGQPLPFYVEAKSWRFHHAPQRVERMKERLLKQLPEDSLGVWAWDKMRDGISGSHALGASGPKLGVEERQVIREVCEAVPQLAAVMVKALDGDLSNIIWTVPSLSSKWPRCRARQLVAILNSETA